MTQTNCVPPTNDVIINGTKPDQQNQKGLNYPSVIKTLSARLNNRFQVEQDSTKSKSSELPLIYLTSSRIQRNQLTQLHQSIINDLKQSLEKNGFIVNVPNVIVNPEHFGTSDCEVRYAELNKNIQISLSSNACDLQSNCLRIGLDIAYQENNFLEMCHLIMTPDLIQKNNKTYQIPIQLGHIKKPFRNLAQSSTYIAETMHCMFKKLIVSQGPHRLLFAKTDNTPKSFVEAMKGQWINIIGQENIAQTIIPIDCYNDQFVIRDAKILESIPADIHLLIAMDSIEIHPAKYRIRLHAMSLKKQLELKLRKSYSVPFGKSLPGCRFQYYTYTSSKGNSLTGEGSGNCDKAMPTHLWSYSAKILAEQSAKQDLSNKIKHLLRKHLIEQDLLYHESILEDKTEIIMNNAILEWEHFEENICRAEARFIIDDKFLPFTIATEPQAITRKAEPLSYSPSVQEHVVQISEPQSITRTSEPLSYSPSVQERVVQISEPQSSNKESDIRVQSFKHSVHEHLAQDHIPQNIIKMIEIIGFVKRKSSVSSNLLNSKRFRYAYEYNLTFVIKNKKICVCKGEINGAGDNVDAAQNDCITALSDLLYPFPLDIALALDNKLSQKDLKQMLISLDTNYFQLLEGIDTLLELIQINKLDK